MFTIIFRFQNYCDIEKLYSQVDLICLRLLYLNSHSDEFSGWLPERKRSVLAEIKTQVYEVGSGTGIVLNSRMLPSSTNMRH